MYANQHVLIVTIGIKIGKLGVNIPKCQDSEGFKDSLEEFRFKLFYPGCHSFLVH